jgi:tetratricopeptide (TPR) repeat protein
MLEAEGASSGEQAAALNSLGVEVWNASLGNRAANLRRAIACYEAALRVRTEADFPEDWAATQNNLGAAHADLPSGDRGENLRRAIACYEAALRVYAEADFPWDFAATCFNRGLALRGSGEREAARASFGAAARGFRAVGDQERAVKAEGLRDKGSPR